MTFGRIDREIILNLIERGFVLHYYIRSSCKCLLKESGNFWDGLIWFAVFLQLLLERCRRTGHRRSMSAMVQMCHPDYVYLSNLTRLASGYEFTKSLKELCKLRLFSN